MHIQNRPYKKGTPRGDAFDRGVAFVETKIKANPAPAAYAELQAAYDYFNRELFGGKLPGVMLSQHRHPRSYGYWAEKRWSAGEDAKAGELALNPEYLKSRPVNDTLAVLVHEQCHVWQTYHGEAPAGPYHNKQWADKMEAVGLMPTSTNLPGGKRTGAHMGHYIIEGGPFDLACKRLLADGFALTWGASMERKAERGETKSGKRNKYVCPDCEAKAWGKEGMQLKCGECDLTMEAA